MSDLQSRSLIWVLKGLRAGDSAQAMELALQLGGRVESKQLAFNHSHALPNWMARTRVSHLTPDARATLRPPWPDLVVATGRRTAPVAQWIKEQSKGHAKLVHIGRPRMALSAFDLVVTTPQYGLPLGPNVMETPVPFAAPKVVEKDLLQHFGAAWHDLPRPWTLAVIGGGKFPLRLSARELANFSAALNALERGSIILLDSPRSPSGAIFSVAKQLKLPHWRTQRGSGPNPYQPALQLCHELIVTSDSVSMMSEMLQTGKPVSVFRLPVSLLAPRWKSRGMMAGLAEKGLLHPPRNVDGFAQKLIDEGYLGDVAAGIKPSKPFSAAQDHAAVILRVRSLLKH